MSDRNVRFLRGNLLSHMIGLLPILIKQFTTIVQGNRLSPNSKSYLYHTLSTTDLLCISSDFFILVRFSSLRHKVLFHFVSGSSSDWCSFFLVTVSVIFSADFSAPDSKVVNPQNPTTNFTQTVTLIFFLHSS